MKKRPQRTGSLYSFVAMDTAGVKISKKKKKSKQSSNVHCHHNRADLITLLIQRSRPDFMKSISLSLWHRSGRFTEAAGHRADGVRDHPGLTRCRPAERLVLSSPSSENKR